MENLKISTFMCVSNPFKRGDLFLEAIESHLLFSDEFIVVDGSSTDGSMDMIRNRFGNRVKIVELEWKQGKGNWKWEEFAKHWNFGLENCTGDWVCATESDHIFHEKDAMLVRQRIDMLGRGRTHLLIDKLVSSTWWAWQSKTKFPLFINKGEFPSICYGLADTPTDLAYPILRTGFNDEFGIPEGTALRDDTGRNMGLYFWNYDKCFKTKDQLFKERDAAVWAWNNSSCVKLQKQPEWNNEVQEGKLLERMKSRYEQSPYQYKIKNYHPTVMQKALDNITVDMLGYSLWGLIK